MPVPMGRNAPQEQEERFDYLENATPKEIAEVMAARQLEHEQNMGQNMAGDGQHDEDEGMKTLYSSERIWIRDC